VLLSDGFAGVLIYWQAFMRFRLLVSLALLLLGAALLVFRGGEEIGEKSENDEPQPNAQPESELEASEEKILKPRNPVRPTRESQRVLYEELLHRVRLARDRRNREVRRSENEIIDSLSELRSFYNECHAIAATTDFEIGDTASVMLLFDVTKRTVVGEVLAESDEVVNADFEECVEETTKALDPRPVDGVRNVSMQMELDFSRTKSDE
jgi:hypothetical protein